MSSLLSFIISGPALPKAYYICYVFSIKILPNESLFLKKKSKKCKRAKCLWLRPELSGTLQQTQGPSSSISYFLQ